MAIFFFIGQNTVSICASLEMRIPLLDREIIIKHIILQSEPNYRTVRSCGHKINIRNATILKNMANVLLKICAILKLLQPKKN